MNVFSVITMLGGLALFLYGMQFMGDSLSKMAGGRLAKILESLTSSTFKGVLLGTLVTAIIQSSSATTVMVVGFVNSGIMNLSQAMGVIMGSNIGTTITSWMLSLTGIESSNLFLQLLKPNNMAPIIAVVGILLLMTNKEDDKKRSIAGICIGFAILMFGMETMSNAVAPLAGDPEFAKVLTAFSNPVLGIIVGAIFTAVIQSSSASVGILQAFCLTGAVNIGTVIPIIMGQNIGTCGTALISSIGASKNAKRASLLHLNFNIIGTAFFILIFYLLQVFFDTTWLKNSASPADVAIVHSLFNIGSTVLLFPFSNFIVKLSEKLIKDRDGEAIYMPASNGNMKMLLDERFLTKPSFAIEICKKRFFELGLKITENTHDTFSLLVDGYKKSVVSDIKNQVILIDEYKDKLEDYLLKLSGKDISKEDAGQIVAMQHSLIDYNSIYEYAISIRKDIHKIHKKGVKISPDIYDDFNEIIWHIKKILLNTANATYENDSYKAKQVELLEEKILKEKKALKKYYLKEIRKGSIDLEVGIILEGILFKISRIAAHCTNIVYAIVDVDSN